MLHSVAVTGVFRELALLALSSLCQRLNRYRLRSPGVRARAILVHPVDQKCFVDEPQSVSACLNRKVESKAIAGFYAEPLPYRDGNRDLTLGRNRRIHRVGHDLNPHLDRSSLSKKSIMNNHNCPMTCCRKP